jgi:uncharacterized caspase-like protein
MGIMLRAVVVGINEYKDEKYRHRARLRFASTDAEKIASLLQSSTMFTAENVTLLRNEEATRKKVRESLDTTFKSRPFDLNTIALFYFAGHGIVNLNDKRISLCCHDVDFADPESGGIRLNDIYEWIASTSAECVIVILDACFSGGIVVGLVGHVSAAQQAMQAIEALRYPEGKTVAIFAACGSDEAARERASLGHGIFTYELLRGWRDGEAKEQKDNIVYLTGLVHFLMQDMTKYIQKPQITIRGSRPIALWKVEQLATNVLSPLAPPAPAPSIIPVQIPGRAGVVYSPVTLPTPTRPQSTNVQERNRLIGIFLIAALFVLVVLGLVIFFIVHLFIH